MTDIHKSCSCFGHSQIEGSEILIDKLRSIFQDLIVDKNVNIFYFGGLGEFDDLCWKIVTELKQKYNDIRRIYCLSDPRHQRLSKRPKWINYDNYEDIVYLELDFDYWYSRIYYRNCEIINRSDYAVFYVNRTINSGAYKIMKYAIKKKREIINVAEEVKD